MEKEFKFNFEKNGSMRIDLFLFDEMEYSRSHICNNLIKKGKVLLNGESTLKCNFILKEDYSIKVIESKENENELLPWNEGLKLLDIVSETNDYLVINKPSGLVVHPGNGNEEKTLVNILLAKKINLSKVHTNRPGIVHRLDKNTSGLMVIAKNDQFHDYFQSELESRKVIKKYIGVVSKELKIKKGIVELPIGRDKNNRKLMTVTRDNSKPAITKYIVIEKIGDFELVEFDLITGRTHQIRVHMKYLNSPLLNDLEYGKKYKESNLREGQYLHSRFISFKEINGNQVTFTKEIDFFS